MNRNFVLSLVMMCLLCRTSQAHEYDPGPDITAGPGEVIVYKYETYWGLRDDPPKTYSIGPGGPFETKGDADKQLDNKIDSTKGNGYLTVTHGKVVRVPYTRSATDPGNPERGINPLSSQSKIVGSNLKSVDPGSSADSRRKATTSVNAKLIRGKKFAAVVGSTKVTIDFATDDKVTIASEILKKSLDAKWYFDDQDRLVINAFNADFVATLSGDKFTGIRTSKDRSDKREWSFSLQNVVDASSSRGKAYNDPTAESKPEKSLTRYWVQSRMFTVNGEWSEWSDIGPTLPVLGVNVGGGPYTQARAQEVLNLARQDWAKTVEQDELSRNGFGVGFTRDDYQFRIVERPSKAR